ncbi:MAG: peptide-methionine (S)-S-oxide reductase [Spirochaetia bacterium]|nr:peptide-methionine (S)-S-oxide reductase [Spirochaetia bacterium]
MDNLEKAYLGGGCFWCLEAIYQLVDGVESIRSGYAGGMNPNPSYKDVCSGMTGHAEIVEVVFNTSKLSYRDILKIFFEIHDPTTLNKQGNDEGSQYRSVIFYIDENQKKIADEEKSETAKNWKNPIVTEISSLPEFYVAEEYHQNYYRTNPGSSYCFFVVRPKVEKFLKKKA